MSTQPIAINADYESATHGDLYRVNTGPVPAYVIILDDTDTGVNLFVHSPHTNTTVKRLDVSDNEMWGMLADAEKIVDDFIRTSIITMIMDGPSTE